MSDHVRESNIVNTDKETEGKETWARDALKHIVHQMSKVLPSICISSNRDEQNKRGE